MQLGADPEHLDRLAAQHEVCAAHLGRVRTRLRSVDRRSWTGPGALRWWQRIDHSIVPSLVSAGNASSAAARQLRGRARDQRRASLPGPAREVLRIDGTGDGRWVARTGGPSARIVVLLVPGVGTDLADIARLRDDADRVWARLAAHAGAERHLGSSAPDDVAVVSWLGYDPPDDVLSGLDPGPAATGAHQLVADVAELRAGGAEHVVVVGHSYGALVATRASSLGMVADELVLLGAPGLGVATVHDLGLAAGARLWSAAAADDPVAVVARVGLVHGPDPAGMSLTLPTSLRGHGSYLQDPTLLDALSEMVLSRR